MLKYILVICIMFSIFFLYSCKKYKKGVCESVFIEGKGSNAVCKFKSEPGGANSCSEEPILTSNDSISGVLTGITVKSKLIRSVKRSHYWEDKSSNRLGYTKKGRESSGSLVCSYCGDTFYANEDGIDKPGANGNFREIEAEFQKLKNGTYTNVIQIQFQGKSITVQ